MGSKSADEAHAHTLTRTHTHTHTDDTHRLAFDISLSHISSIALSLHFGTTHVFLCINMSEVWLEVPVLVTVEKLSVVLVLIQYIRVRDPARTVVT